MPNSTLLYTSNHAGAGGNIVGQSNNESNDFIVTRHAQFVTDERIVFDLVRKATDNSPISRKKIVRGNDNEVYIVDTEECNQFIVRIKRFGEVSLAQEAWAIELCKYAGVRVPEILLVDNIDSHAERLEVMVQSIMPGGSDPPKSLHAPRFSADGAIS